MRLSPRFQAVLYTVVAVLFVTGVVWLTVDRAVWPELATDLLRVHGAAAMVMLVLLGTLLPLHARVGWRRGRNVASGILMLASNGLLVLTALGLYYAGSDTFRYWTSELHVGLGVALPLLITGHVIVGRRGRAAARAPRPAAAQGR